jgi:hypothetical protein
MRLGMTLVLLAACSGAPTAPRTVWFAGQRGGPATLWQVDVDGGAPRALPARTDLVEVSPSGKRAAIWRPDGTTILDETGAPVHEISQQFVSFLDDDQALTSSGELGQPATIERVRLSTGEVTPVATLPGPLQRRLPPSITPAGDLLLAAGGAHRVHLADGALTRLPGSHLREGPGGKLLGMDIATNTTRVWSSDGAVLHTLPASLHSVWLDAEHAVLFRRGNTRADGSSDGPMALVRVTLRDGAERLLVAGLPLQDEVYAFPPCVIDHDTIITVGPGATSVLRLDLQGDEVRTTPLAEGLQRVGHLACPRR